MTLPDLLAAANPGPWATFDVGGYRTGIGHLGCDTDCIGNAHMENNAALMALAPEMAALLIEARDELSRLCDILGEPDIEIIEPLLARIDGLTDRRTEA